MPYQTPEYTPPILPLLGPVRTFEEVRAAVGRIFEYLQRQQQMDVQYFMQLRENLNHSATQQGHDLPAVDPLVPTSFMHVVTGTGTITNITPPYNFAGQLMLVSHDGFYLQSGGNISLFQSPNYLNPTAHIMLTYIPSIKLWMADTCRLHTAPGVLKAHGRVEE